MNRLQHSAHGPRVNMLAGMATESRLVLVVSESQYLGSLELLATYWSGGMLPELVGKLASVFPFGRAA